ncbi:MAG: AraC family transcriptional regulator [Oscillospiraceae bacterium]|nr:AraC family transcriptional regulator [Oscillospiraceae bacterium]
MKNYKFRVIVADDEKLIAKNIALSITRANPAFDVVSVVGDGQEAYDLIRKLLPDVVFCDIKMPVMDGLELISKIYAEMPFIKTVIISGYSDFQYARTALQQHSSDYLLKPLNPDELQATLKKLERELLAVQNEISIERQSQPIDIVESVKAHLRHNYAQTLNFSDISAHYGFSSAYLSKIFKEHTGTSPGKYLNEYRINIAKKLLMDSNLSVKDIAQKVGFEDQFHFSKNFKNTVGISPLQFREQWK